MSKPEKYNPNLKVVSTGRPKPLSVEEGLNHLKRGLDPIRAIYRKQTESAAELSDLAVRGARGELRPKEGVEPDSNLVGLNRPPSRVGK